MNKEAELKRLAKKVFEGAPDWCTHAAKDSGSGFWLWFRNPELKPESGIWVCVQPCVRTCKNQPETELPWTETLICRSDYE